MSVKITLMRYSPLIVTFITTLTFPIYIRSISVLMFSINLGFLTITMRPEQKDAKQVSSE